MTIKKKPYVDYTLDEEKDPNRGEVLRVRLNRAEYKDLQDLKKILLETRDSTAIKLMMQIAADVLQRDSTGRILRIVLNNKRKNRRAGRGFD